MARKNINPPFKTVDKIDSEGEISCTITEILIEEDLQIK
jgi:hypothetical protein